jgi:hypothetical protein
MPAGPADCGRTATADTVGAASAVDKLATGLSLTKGAATLEVVGAVDAPVREKAYELGGTLAALLME